MVHNIFKQEGKEIGVSLYDPKYLVPEKLMHHPDLLVPIDVTTSDGVSKKLEEVRKEDKIVDAGKGTITLLEKYMDQAQTIVFNGPIGLYEEGWRYGTEMLLTYIAQAKSPTRIIGGGDTLSVLESLQSHTGNLRFSFVSLAGGAMLSFITHGTIAGLEALTRDVTL
jgi:phosphoglycerate kinase